MITDAVNSHPDRVLSYEFGPSGDPADVSYIEEEDERHADLWALSQVGFITAHDYQANFYLFQNEPTESPEDRQPSPTSESGVLRVRVTAEGNVVVPATAVRALGLSPGDEIQVQINKPKIRRSMRGLVAGESRISEADLSEIRSEMWRNFPRDLPR